jgi:ACS family tartrate transporter-like MFS transporter
MRRIMPYLFGLFVIAYLDRVNLGYAKLQMSAATGFSESVFGFGAGIFFIGYFILEIPGTILVEKWSARRWIARIMITWGFFASAMAFVHTRHQFYLVRFLLGASEAGFFPGLIVYLGHWFRRRDRGRAIALFMAAVPISNLIGAPVSGLLLQTHWLGLAGWRWVFLVEGIPAVIFGIVTIFYLTDRPRQARWLSPDEQEWIEAALESERQEIAAGAPFSDVALPVTNALKPSQVIQFALAYFVRVVTNALKQREVVLLALAYFFMVTVVYGFNFWLPSILKRLSGLSDLTVTFLTVIPYAVGLIAMLILASSSDRTGERRWHAAGPMMIAAVGLFTSALLQNHAGLALSMFSLAAAGIYGYFAGFWALPGSLLTGAAGAAAIGLINSVGNLGGFVGPSIVGYVKDRTGSYAGGVFYLSMSAIVASICVLAVRHKPHAETQH